MNLKIYLNILKTGIYLSFVSVFLVFSNLLFPYITSKQIFFNIIIEILAIFWLGLIIKYPLARPKKSLITFGLAAFYGALLMSSIFSVDFNLSFWGDVERMLGWFHIFHFFLFYLIIITVFREQRDWRNLFVVSVVASTLVCLYSLFKIPYSTIGNTAYVSGYAIFNIYFALILFFQRREEESAGRLGWFLSAAYLLAAIIMLLVMKQTNTRGAYVGLGLSFLLFFILFAAYSRSRKIKIYSLAAAVLGVSFIGLVFMFPRSGWVSKTPVLNTITQISSAATTFQTRLISWEAALKDFPNHILLGTGYGNYAITFDKFFDPKFYDYTTSETYFDRAHNNLVDLASTAGSLGLFTYLSVFAAVFYYLRLAKEQNKISINEFILLSCLLVAYFIQNLAVFDSLVTYISLMLALGYVYWLANKNEPEELGEGGSGGLSNKELGVLAVAGLVILSVMYQYNIKVLFMLDGTIKGQIKLAQGNLPAAAEEYKKALSYQTVLDRDSRSSLINALNSRQEELAALSQPKAGEIADYVIGLAEANVKLNPNDSMAQMQLAQSLNTAASLYQRDQNKFYYYSGRALKAIDESIKASPGRVTVYFAKAQMHINRNDKASAIATLKYAFGLNENYAEAACYLAKVEIYFKEEAEGYAHLNQCLDLNGSGYLSPLDFVKAAINHYSPEKDEARTLILYQRWADLEPNNAKLWVNLSLLYAQSGDKAGAISAAEKAASLDPSLRQAAAEFIKGLR